MAMRFLHRATLIAAAIEAVAGCGGARAGAPSGAKTSPVSSAVADRPAIVSLTAPRSRPPLAHPAAAGFATASAIAPTPMPVSAVATTKIDDAWSLCHRSYKPSATDLANDVTRLAKTCQPQTKMTLVGKTLTGRQADQERPESFALDARANHCYRVYARAADSILHLDLAIKDSAGVVVGQDSTDDSTAVVLENGAVCFRLDDKASLVVSVGMGNGAYAVQIWGD